MALRVWPEETRASMRAAEEEEEEVEAAAFEVEGEPEAEAALEILGFLLGVAAFGEDLVEAGMVASAGWSVKW